MMSLAELLVIPESRRPTLSARWGALLLAALLPLLGACAGGSAESTEPSAEEPAPTAAERAVPVRTVAPDVEDVADVASLPAEILPLRRAVLAAEVSGVVESLSFEAGQQVGRGKTLLAVDTRSLEQAVAEAQAIDRQRRLQRERGERLFEKRSITQQQLLDLVTAREVAAARLASAELELSKSQVKAPWAGRISQRYVEIGDFVSPGQPVAELLDTRRLKVRAPAPAADVPLLSVGSEVRLRVDALPGEEIRGRIVRLGAEVDARARTLDVEAEIDNPGDRLRPGMPARLELERRTLEGAVLVPLAAVVDLGDSDGVFVVDAGRAEQRPVTLGPVQGGRVVVVEGLAAGEVVVTEGARQLVDGQRVTEAAEG